MKLSNRWSYFAALNTSLSSDDPLYNHPLKPRSTPELMTRERREYQSVSNSAMQPRCIEEAEASKMDCDDYNFELKAGETTYSTSPFQWKNDPTAIPESCLADNRCGLSRKDCFASMSLYDSSYDQGRLTIADFYQHIMNPGSPPPGYNPAALFRRMGGSVNLLKAVEESSLEQIARMMPTTNYGAADTNWPDSALKRYPMNNKSAQNDIEEFCNKIEAMAKAVCRDPFYSDQKFGGAPLRDLGTPEFLARTMLHPICPRALPLCRCTSLAAGGFRLISDPPMYDDRTSNILHKDRVYTPKFVGGVDQSTTTGPENTALDCSSWVNKFPESQRPEMCNSRSGCSWVMTNLACGRCQSASERECNGGTAMNAYIARKLSSPENRQCAAQPTKERCSQATQSSCAAWVMPPANVDNEHPQWQWWRATKDDTPYCCTDAHDQDGNPSVDAADGFDDSDMLKSSYTIVYEDCPDRGPTLGASLGYAGLFELAITIIVLPLLMYSGVLNRDGECAVVYAVGVLEKNKNELQKQSSIAGAWLPVAFPSSLSNLFPFRPRPTCVPHTSWLLCFRFHQASSSANSSRRRRPKTCAIMPGVQPLRPALMAGATTNEVRHILDCPATSIRTILERAANELQPFHENRIKMNKLPHVDKSLTSPHSTSSSYCCASHGQSKEPSGHESIARPPPWSSRPTLRLAAAASASWMQTSASGSFAWL